MTVETSAKPPITPQQHAVMLDVSDGDWVSLVPKHSRAAVAQLFSYGMIRCDYETVLYPDRLWKITPRGEAYLGWAAQ